MTKTETIISDIYDAWRAQDLDRLREAIECGERDTERCLVVVSATCH
jgi:hypothetical protein